MITIEELSGYLEENTTDLSWHHNKQENALYIHSDKWNETIKIDLDRLDKLTLDLIKFKLKGGKDVAQITRVTGYFSHTTYWNPGKRAELRDRYRINKIQSNQSDD